MRGASPRVQALLAALDAAPGLTVRELAERTAYGTRLLHQLLWRLERDGEVVHEGHRWYRVPGQRSDATR
jgi:DNA-binding IclR family transcriptional regulator